VNKGKYKYQYLQQQFKQYIWKYLYSPMINKEAALKKIEELVQRFEEQIVSYKKAEYCSLNYYLLL